MHDDMGLVQGPHRRGAPRSRGRGGLAWLLVALCSAQAVAQAQTLRERLAARRAAAEPTAAAAPAALGSGTHTLSVRQGDDTRQLIVHVPAAYDGRAAWPLVLALHGGGGHAAHMVDDDRYGLMGQADRSGFIVAFPNGHSRLPGGRFATWNAGACCGDARDQQADDVGLLKAVVAQLQARLKVDPQRVFATGMSNGGMMVHRLACEASDVFRAVASVAGTDATQTCQPSRPVAVLHIHARDDDHVLFNGGAGAAAFRDPSKVMAFVSVPDTIARWVLRDQCSAAVAPVLDRPGVHCEAHPSCAGGVTVQLCVTDTGGHAWPGASASRLGKAAPSQALNANEVIWDFFQRSSAAQR